MKILGRIMFALAFALLLIVVHNLGNRLAADKYLNEEGKKMYLSDHEDRYRMFYGSTGFHLDEPTYELTNNEYHIQFFEINKAFINKQDDVRVDEYFYIIVDHPINILTIDHPQRYYMRFSNSNNELLTLEIHQFKEISFSVVVDEDDQGLIEAFQILDKNYSKIDIIDFNAEEESETVLATYEINFSASDLKIKPILLLNYDNESILNQNGINVRYKVDSSKYNYIYFLMMGSYLIFVVAITYFTYFINRKKPGKVQPSKHFYKKDNQAFK